MKKVIKFIHLTGVFIWWSLRYPLSWQENIQDIKFRWWYETSEEGKRIQKQIDSL